MCVFHKHGKLSVMVEFILASSLVPHMYDTETSSTFSYYCGCMWQTSRGSSGPTGEEFMFMFLFSPLLVLLVRVPWICVCVCAACLVWSMITLVFLQVLEPFCPLSEQENSDPEEVEVIQPASSATVLIPLQAELNPCSLSSDSLAPKELSCDTVLTETSVTPVPFTAISAASFSDTNAGLPPPAPSDPQPRSGSGSPDFNSPSESHSGAHSVEDDSTPPHPPSSSPFIDMITIHPSKTPADDSNCTPGIV